MSQQLNPNQISNLKLTLKFRYLTTNNLARGRSITHYAAYRALEILHANGYLDKIHDKSYHLLNKSARYYLTHQALDYLRNDLKLELHEALWKSRLSDQKRTPEFIDQQVAIHAAYNDLRALLGDEVKILTPTEMYGLEGIIKPLPGLLVEPNIGNRFFIDLTDSQHLFVVKKRLRQYLQNYDNEEWDWQHYPDVYLVRSLASDRTRLRKYIEEQMDNSYLDSDDFSVFVIRIVNQIRVK